MQKSNAWLHLRFIKLMFYAVWMQELFVTAASGKNQVISCKFVTNQKLWISRLDKHTYLDKRQKYRILYDMFELLFNLQQSVRTYPDFISQHA